MDSWEPRAQPFYRDAAKIWGVSWGTWRRRHQGSQATHTGAASHKQKFNEQELELLRYVKEITEKVLPPTRAMIRNFGSAVAQDPCSDCWVFQCLEQNKAHLTSKWTIKMGRHRIKADNKDRYYRCFKHLYTLLLFQYYFILLLLLSLIYILISFNYSIYTSYS